MLSKSGLRIHHVAILWVAIATLISGCVAAPYNSGFQEKAPGVYFLSVRSATETGACCLTGEESRLAAVAQANDYCGRSRQKAEVTSEEVGPATADIFFVCVDK
jgi:hypothetical protein